MKTETTEYLVLDHLLAYFINADSSGLTDDEIEEVNEFEHDQVQWAMRRPGYVSHHRSHDGDYSENFGRCEITKCFGNRSTLVLVIMFNEVNQ